MAKVNRNCGELFVPVSVEPPDLRPIPEPIPEPMLMDVNFVNGTPIASTLTTTTLPAIFWMASGRNGVITHYAIIVLELPTGMQPFYQVLGVF